MSLTFEITKRSYAIEIDIDRFHDLADSESYVSGNAAFTRGKQTLCEKLDALPDTSDIEYNGHFGNFVYVTIDAEADTPELQAQIAQIIEDHLDWCATLPKAQHVIEERAAAKASAAP